MNNIVEIYSKKIARIGRALASLPHDHRILGFGQGQNVILFALERSENGLSPGELSHLLNVGSGRIANVLLAFEKANLITREVDQRDRRKTIVKITESGKKYASSQKETFERFVQTAVETLGDENFSLFLDLYGKLAEKMVEMKLKEERYV